MTPPRLAKPYVAVIFTSQLREGVAGYAKMSERMLELAAEQPGFLGIDSARNADGTGVTVSYWDSLAAAKAWGQEAEHSAAQRLGRERWYESFEIRVAEVKEERDFFLSEERP